MRVLMLTLALLLACNAMAQGKAKYTRNNYMRTYNGHYQLIVPSNDRFNSDGITIDLGTNKSDALKTLRALAETIEESPDETTIHAGKNGVAFKVRKWEQGEEIYSDIATPNEDGKSLYVIPLSQIKRCIKQLN
ncbi:MAG: hypothetical protein K5864_06030 [Bacteroidales bacterium]|nr:hypothetical protein [Bacteroidales bacterium]